MKVDPTPNPKYTQDIIQTPQRFLNQASLLAFTVI